MYPRAEKRCKQLKIKRRNICLLKSLHWSRWSMKSRGSFQLCLLMMSMNWRPGVVKFVLHSRMYIVFRTNLTNLCQMSIPQNGTTLRHLAEPCLKEAVSSLESAIYANWPRTCSQGTEIKRQTAAGSLQTAMLWHSKKLFVHVWLLFSFIQILSPAV